MNNLADFLKTETDQRLLRLFAVGCCRQIWDLLIDQRSRTAVEVAERFADGQATLEELKKAHDASWAAVHDAAYWTAYLATYHAASNASYCAAYDAAYLATIEAARERQLELYHCLFTKIVFSTTSQNAINLAKLIYQERNWSLMPILGDALEEAGATEEVISHCKEKEHARGCWVVDNILRKR